MNDTEAFLRKIRENPEDDAPRLVFADYLDEQAQKSTGKDAKEQAKWAALIRAQIAEVRETVADASYWNKWAGLTWQEPSRLAREVLPEFFRKGGAAYTSRGFYDQLYVSLNNLVLQSQALGDSAVPVQKLTFSHFSEGWHQIAGHPVLSLIRNLDFFRVGALSTNDLRAICDDTQLRALTGLAIDIQDTDDIHTIFKDSEIFPCLRQFQIHFSDVIPDRELLNYPCFSKLELFDVGSPTLETAELLSQAPLAKSLTKLTINDFGEEPPKKLKWGSFKKLESLSIWNSSDKDWVTPFLASQDWTHLKELDLLGESIPDDVLSHFESCENEFSLQLSQISQAQLKSLLSSKTMKRVKALRVWTSPFPSTYQILSKNETAINLRSFEYDLRERSYNPEPIFKMLCKSSVFANLLHLDVSETLTLNLLKQLADSPLGQSLRALKCIDFDQPTKCEEFMRDPKHFPHLVWLSTGEFVSSKNRIAKGRKKLKLT